MYLNRLKEPIQKISFKLFFLYGTVFVLSAILLFFGSYILLLSSLKEQDHNEIKAEAKEFLELFQQGGVDLVQSRLAMGKKFETPERYFLRLADRENKTVLLRLPYQWASFYIKELEIWYPSEEAWKKLKAEDGTTYLEVYTLSAANGYWIQVGKTSEQRDKILKRFQEISSLILISLLLLGTVSGAILSRRALKPVRELISIIKALDIKNLRERVPEPSSKDEIRELVILFNQLLDRISRLVFAMRRSFDSVAHDLRTPIARMRGTAEMALLGDGTPETLREALSDCVEESDKVLRLLNAIMDITEAEAGALRLKKEPLDLKDLLTPLVELYYPVAEEKGVSVVLEVPQGLGILGDQVRLSQAMANLLDNAVKYTKEKSLVKITGLKRGESVEVIFEDEGPGLDKEEAERIWEWFYRSEGAKGKRGFGIGLAIVKAIVEAHEGRIRVDVGKGTGARFVVELPSIQNQAPSNSPIYN